jgi:hypothetical protein
MSLFLNNPVGFVAMEGAISATRNIFDVIIRSPNYSLNAYWAGKEGYGPNFEQLGPSDLIPSPDQLIHQWRSTPNETLQELSDQLKWFGINIGDYKPNSNEFDESKNNFGNREWQRFITAQQTPPPLEVLIAAGQLGRIPAKDRDGVIRTADQMAVEWMCRHGFKEKEARELLFNQPWVPPAEDVRILHSIGAIPDTPTEDQPSYAQRLAAAGIPNPKDQSLFEKFVQVPTYHETNALYFRDFLKGATHAEKLAEYKRLLAREGFTDPQIQEYLYKLRLVIPTNEDLIRMSNKWVFNTYLARALGLDQELDEMPLFKIWAEREGYGGDPRVSFEDFAYHYGYKVDGTLIEEAATFVEQAKATPEVQAAANQLSQAVAAMVNIQQQVEQAQTAANAFSVAGFTRAPQVIHAENLLREKEEYQRNILDPAHRVYDEALALAIKALQGKAREELVPWDEVNRLFKFQDMTLKFWYQADWRMHWINLSPAQAYEGLRRLRPYDSTRVPPQPGETPAQARERILAEWAQVKEAIGKIGLDESTGGVLPDWTSRRIARERERIVLDFTTKYGRMPYIEGATRIRTGANGEPELVDGRPVSEKVPVIPMDESDVNLLLRANDYPPYFRDRLAAISYELPRLVDIRRALQLSYNNADFCVRATGWNPTLWPDRTAWLRAWATELFQDRGQSPTNAAMIAELAVYAAEMSSATGDRRRRDLAIRRYQRYLDGAYKSGFIDRAFYANENTREAIDRRFPHRPPTTTTPRGPSVGQETITAAIQETMTAATATANVVEQAVERSTMSLLAFEISESRLLGIARDELRLEGDQTPDALDDFGQQITQNVNDVLDNLSTQVVQNNLGDVIDDSTEEE